MTEGNVNQKGLAAQLTLYYDSAILESGRF